jgi:hypothetical protein
LLDACAGVVYDVVEGDEFTRLDPRTRRVDCVTRVFDEQRMG